MNTRCANSRIPVFLVVCVLMVAGCKQSEQSASGGDPVPDDLKIMFGLHGAEAGRDRGHSINADGEVIQWVGLYPEQNRQATGRADAEEVRRLWSHADSIGFLEMEEQVMAAAYWFISVSANGESRRVTWVERDDAAPTPAQEFFDACSEVAQTALGKD